MICEGAITRETEQSRNCSPTATWIPLLALFPHVCSTCLVEIHLILTGMVLFSHKLRPPPDMGLVMVKVCSLFGGSGSRVSLELLETFLIVADAMLIKLN